MQAHASYTTTEASPSVVNSGETFNHPHFPTKFIKLRSYEDEAKNDHPEEKTTSISNVVDDITKRISVPTALLHEKMLELESKCKYLREESQRIVTAILTKYNNILQMVGKFSLKQSRIINSAIMELNKPQPNRIQLVTILANLDLNEQTHIVEAIIDLATECSNETNNLKVKKTNATIAKITCIGAIVGGLGALAAAVVLPFAAPAEIAIGVAIIGGAVAVTGVGAYVVQGLALQTVARMAEKDADRAIEYMKNVKDHLDQIKDQIDHCNEDMTTAAISKAMEDLLATQKSLKTLREITNKQVVIGQSRANHH